MAYDISLKSSALRHFEDARRLDDASRFDNAGYHYGLSAECSVKHLLSALGVPSGDSAMWSHFPDLINLAKLSLKGRRATALNQLLHVSLLGGWNVRMRYAKNGSVSGDTANKWRDQANKAIGLLYA